MGATKQMLTLYSKDAVEPAIFVRDYTEYSFIPPIKYGTKANHSFPLRALQKDTDDLKAQIQQGIHAETCQEGLDLITRTTSLWRP